MREHAVMVQLWTKLRSAVKELRISRLQRKSDSRFFVIERRACVRRRRKAPPSSSSVSSSSSARRVLLGMRGKELKRALHDPKRSIAAAANFKAAAATNSKRDRRVMGAGADEDTEDDEDEGGEEESLALVLTRWEETSSMEIGSFSPEVPKQIDVAAISPSKRLEDINVSFDCESTVLTSSISLRPAFRPGGQSSASTHFDYHRWQNRDWRLSYRSPQLLEPVRGKLTTLSSLMKTMSDRYARRTGKLTPLHERATKKPLLTQSLSASPWIFQHQKFNPTPRTSVDLGPKRYENPFQDFLRQSYAERNSKFASSTFIGTDNR